MIETTVTLDPLRAWMHQKMTVEMMTKGQLAELCGVTPMQLWRILKGCDAFTQPSLSRLCQRTGLDVGQILCVTRVSKKAKKKEKGN